MAFQRGYSKQGLEQANVGQIPTNENPKVWMVDAYDIKGGVQTLISITDLIEFHPFKMRKGMSMRVVDYPNIGTITEFVLNTDPNLLLDSNEATIVNGDNFVNFWDKTIETNTSFARVYEYAPDKNGGIPIYPYTGDPGFEDSWSPIYDTSQGHKWLRFRDDDEDSNADNIFDNWTVPIPISQQPAPGDFIENRFQRFIIDETVYVDKTTFEANVVLNRFYIVLKGDVDVDNGGDVTNETKGRTFEHIGGTYTFNNSAQVKETIPAPPRVVGGVPNNEPLGWTDTPSGTLITNGILWKIFATKSAYGELKSQWLIQQVKEDPNYVRYSQAAAPNPREFVDRNTLADDGSAGDTALINAGWANTFGEENFIATREDDPDPGFLFTDWLVEKIAAESGEFQDRVFKLFDLNLDNNDPELQPPINRDPTSEGWADAPVLETDTQINYVSEARKFIDGTLKTPWSDPVPYTGKDTFSDIVSSDLGDNFKYDQDDNVEPAAGITLTSKLFKGNVAMWENVVNIITYEWKKVFDNGAVVDESPDGSTWSLLPAVGTIRDNQAVLITPAAVTGKAVFRATQTLTLAVGDPIVFVEEYSIVDITDGVDSRSIAVSVDQQTIIYDATNLIFVPVDSTLRGYQANIPGWSGNGDFKWYVWDGISVWIAITGAEPEYTIVDNVLTVDNSLIFIADGSSQEKRYALSNHATNPDLADNIITFSDYTTLVKLAAANVGSPGADSAVGVLSNEAHTIVLDNTTGNPFAGEIGVGNKATTLLQVFDGPTLQVYLTDYTIAILSDEADVTFGSAANGNNVDIYVDTWVSSGGAASPTRNATGTITVTLGSRTIIKEFTLATTLDAPGAIILDLDSDKGFSFVPDDRTDKTFTANLYDSNIVQTSGYEYQFLLGGIEVQAWSTTKTYVLTRAQVSGSTELTSHVRPTAGAILRSRTVQVTDVLDSKQYRLYYSYATIPAEPIAEPTKPADSTITTFETDYPATGTGWARDSQGDSIVWASDGEEQASGALVFSRSYRIRGEQGDQGPNGDFFFQMYYSATTVPAIDDPTSQTWDLATMKAHNWESLLPLSGKIWMSLRAWEGGTFTAGDPSGDPVAGTSWSSPAPLSATDGSAGVDGDDGTRGWAPILGVVASGSTKQVLQLKDWTGGTGSKPGFIGQYLSTSGFTTNISSASNIKGSDGADGDPADTGIVELVGDNSPANGGNAFFRSSSPKYSSQRLIDNRSNAFDVLVSIFGTVWVEPWNQTSGNEGWVEIQVRTGSEVTGGSAPSATTERVARSSYIRRTDSNNQDRNAQQISVMGFIKVRAGYMRNIRTAFYTGSSSKEFNVGVVQLSAGVR